MKANQIDRPRKQHRLWEGSFVQVKECTLWLNCRHWEVMTRPGSGTSPAWQLATAARIWGIPRVPMMFPAASANGCGALLSRSKWGQVVTSCLGDSQLFCEGLKGREQLYFWDFSRVDIGMFFKKGDFFFTLFFGSKFLFVTTIISS